MSMRHPSSLSRGRSMRRTQRSSQRSADSKLTAGSGIYQPGAGTDSGVASVAESDRVPGVTSLTSDRIPGAVEDNGVERKKKSTTLMLEVRPETGNGVQYLDAPKTGPGAVTPSEDNQADRETGRVSARDRLVLVYDRSK